MSLEIKRLIKKSEGEENTSPDSSDNNSQEAQDPENSKTELKSKPERPKPREYQSTKPNPIKRTSLPKHDDQSRSSEDTSTKPGLQEKPTFPKEDDTDKLEQSSKVDQEQIGVEQGQTAEDESHDQEKGDLKKEKPYELLKFEALLESYMQLLVVHGEVNQTFADITDTSPVISKGDSGVFFGKHQIQQLTQILEEMYKKDDTGVSVNELIDDPLLTKNLSKMTDTESKLPGRFMESITEKVLQTVLEKNAKEDSAFKIEKIDYDTFDRVMALETAYALNSTRYNKAKEDYENPDQNSEENTAEENAGENDTSRTVLERDADISEILDWFAGIDTNILQLSHNEEYGGEGNHVKKTLVGYDLTKNLTSVSNKMKTKTSQILNAYVAGEFGGEDTPPYNHITLVLDKFDATSYQAATEKSNEQDPQTPYGEAYLQAHYIKQIADQEYLIFDKGIQAIYELVEERNKKQNQNAERHEDDEQQVENDESIYFPSLLYGSEVQAIIEAKEQMDSLEDLEKAAALKETLISFVDSIDQERPSTGRILDKLANQQKGYIENKKKWTRNIRSLRDEYQTEEETTPEQAHILAQDMIRCQNTLHNMVLERIGDGNNVNTEISDQEILDSFQSVVFKKLKSTHSEKIKQIRADIQQLLTNISNELNNQGLDRKKLEGEDQSQLIQDQIQNMMKINHILPAPCGPVLGSQINNEFSNRSNTEFPDADNPYPNHATWLSAKVTRILNTSVD